MLASFSFFHTQIVTSLNTNLHLHRYRNTVVVVVVVGVVVVVYSHVGLHVIYSWTYMLSVKRMFLTYIWIVFNLCI